MEETIYRYATYVVALKEEIREYEFEISWFTKRLAFCKEELVIYENAIEQLLNHDDRYLYDVWEELIY